MDDRRHEWDLLEQAQPAIPKPFGFVCGCGELLTESFSSLREAVQAAERHAGGIVDRPAA